MKRLTIGTVILTMALASAAGAAPTAEQKCHAAKLNAFRNRAYCLDGEKRNALLGKTPDTARCEDKFTDAIAAADKVAIKKNVPCRWIEHGDGTATDLTTGLQWELKTDDGSIHDKDHLPTFNLVDTGTTRNGTAFTVFLATLNGDGTPAGCFTGRCDWRMPTIGELRSILIQPSVRPDCPHDPCTSIPGFVRDWSRSSTSLLHAAWFVSLKTGWVTFTEKSDRMIVQAVRGGPAR